MEKEKTIEILNTLININNDRIKGYVTASIETQEQDLKNLFAQLSTTSLKCKQELVNAVNSLGGDVAKKSMTTGIFYWVWMNVKLSLTCNDRKAILESCEFGEDIAISTYKNALKDNLEYSNAKQRHLLNNHLSILQADRNVIKTMLVTM
jgi:uncharacterized protein (TIGR02284 family)